MIYVVLLGCEAMDRIVPLEFLLLDCSKMLLGPGSQQAAMISSFGFTFECSVSCAVPIADKPADLRALVIDIVRYDVMSLIISIC